MLSRGRSRILLSTCRYWPNPLLSFRGYSNQTLPATEDYSRLLLNDVPLIDVRAPVEFVRGAFPCSTNLPILNDEFRADIGTTYKNKGKEEAVSLGHELVSGPEKDRIIEKWRQFLKLNPTAALYCFRGGLRSQVSQQWINEHCEVDVPRVVGGYKAIRTFIMEEIERLSHTTKFFVVGGRTGVGKTVFLQRFPTFLDLEGFANHRGSAFGTRASPQPTQINFENIVTIKLMKLNASQVTPVIVEDESRAIGSVHLPPPLRAALQESPLVVIHSSIEDRVETTLQAYVLDSLRERSEAAGPEQGFVDWTDYLRSSLKKISKKLGLERYQNVCGLLEDAIRRHEATGETAGHREWIAFLLTGYYDPMYDYQIENNTKRGRVVHQGDHDSVRQFLESL